VGSLSTLRKAPSRDHCKATRFMLRVLGNPILSFPVPRLCMFSIACIAFVNRVPEMHSFRLSFSNVVLCFGCLFEVLIGVGYRVGCACVFIGVNVRACISICVCTVFLKKKSGLTVLCVNKN
jgi:hypothetical protein